MSADPSPPQLVWDEQRWSEQIVFFAQLTSSRGSLGVVLSRRTRRTATLAGVAVAIFALSVLSGAVAQAAPANLVANPSLEDGAAWPTCFSASGWGTDGTWSIVPGHTGGRAVSVKIAGHTAGDRKLLPSESTACAPAVAEGQTYEIGVWYSSTAPVNLTMFRHSAAGWSYWGDLGTKPAAATWQQAKATTPAIPAGTDRIVFGLSLATDGTLVTDDYTLWRTNAPEESPTPTPSATPTPSPTGPPNLVANPDLAVDGALPQCFMQAGWGTHTATSVVSNAVPSSAPAGARAYSLTMTGYVSGDEKLIQSEAVGCAPSVQPGKVYTLGVDYTSTTNATGLTVFQHTATGWSYWTDLGALAGTAAWTRASATLPVVPAGVDRISFGVSLAANGTLTTTGYTLAERVVAPPTPGPAPGTPAVVGAWNVLNDRMPLRAIHTTLLHDGRVLLVAGSGNDGNAFAAGTFTAYVWDPTNDTYLRVPVPYDMFCAGHVTLPDGKVLLSGGTQAFPAQNQGPNTFKGSKKSYYFDPDDNTFHATNDMAGAHWYPTLTKLGNGDLWAAGGLDDKAEGTVLTEMFDSSEMRWLPSNQVPQTWSFWGTYPHMYLLDDGMLFYAGGHTFGNGLPGTGASLYDWKTAQIWDVPGLREKDLRDQAGSVILPPAQDQKVMIVGGGNTDSNKPAIPLVDIIDLSVAAPHYEPGPDLPGPGKAYVNLLNLPDRTVLAADGAVYNRSDNVLTAALYDPVAKTWKSIDPDPVGRNYHSTAIVLPDGRVAIFGSNPADNSFETRVSIYSPPYLFRGERPKITQAPDAAAYGDTFVLGTTGTVVSASLMAPMSSTHQTDTNARLVDVPLTVQNGVITAHITANENLLPPGPYMLTVLNAAGVPSIAKWMWIS